MKKLIVPEGQTLKQAEVTAGLLVVDGTLIVAGDVKAAEIRGKGSVVAENIKARKCLVRYPCARDTLRADFVRAQRVEAHYADIKGALLATVCAVVPCLRAKRVAAALLCSEHIDAEECVVVPQREYSAMRFALTVFVLRLLYLSGNRSARKRTAKHKKRLSRRVDELDERIRRLEGELSLLRMQAGPETVEQDFPVLFPDAA